MFKILLILLMSSNSLFAGQYMRHDLIGIWTNETSKSIFIFNPDFSCTFHIEEISHFDKRIIKDNITGTWSVTDVENYVIVTDRDHMAKVFKFTMVDDGGVRDGKLLTRLGLYYCGESWDSRHDCSDEFRLVENKIKIGK